MGCNAVGSAGLPEFIVVGIEQQQVWKRCHSCRKWTLQASIQVRQATYASFVLNAAARS